VILPPSVSKLHACQFDFSPLRAPDLNGDLALRDFTINSMAIDLAQISPLRIIDPLGGRNDLARKRLHICSPTVLDDDPLRILKGLRHCATLGLRLSHETSTACATTARGLAKIAPERVRSEMAGIFSAQHLTHLCYALNELHRCGAATELKLSHASSDILEQYACPALERAFTLLDLCSDERYLRTRLNWNAGDEFNYQSLGLLGTWLRNSTAPEQGIPCAAPQLKLSRKGITWLKWFLTCPEDIITQLEHLKWQRYPRRAQQHLALMGAPLPHGLAALVFFARHSADIHNLAQLWHIAGVCLDKGRLKPLIPASQIQQLYPKLQGKDLGTCLRHLSSAERQGAIHSISDGWEWVKEYARKHGINPNSPQGKEQ
jgi:hypothetical protein